MARRYSYTKEVYVEQYEGREDSEILESYNCGRCSGARRFDHYGRVADGVCFRCGGDPGFREIVTVGDRRQEQRSQVRHLNKARMLAAKADVLWAEAIAEMATEHPAWGTLTRWEGILDMESEDANEFVIKLALRITDGKPLSEKQIAAGANAIDRFNRKDEIAAAKAAAHAATPPVVGGRQEITGQVVSIKRYENTFSYAGGTDYKFLIQDAEGRRYFGTMPNAAWEALEQGLDLDDYKGRTVTLTATVAPSADDHAFGKYSRPAKFSLAPKAN